MSNSGEQLINTGEKLKYLTFQFAELDKHNLDTVGFGPGAFTRTGGISRVKRVPKSGCGIFSSGTMQIRRFRRTAPHGKRTVPGAGIRADASQ